MTKLPPISARRAKDPVNPSLAKPLRVIATTGSVLLDGCCPIDKFTLNNDGLNRSEVVLDYGQAEGGRPIFEILVNSSTCETVSFQTTYSETRREVSHDNGDGPFLLFSNAMDTYRTVTHKVALTGSVQRIRSRYAQRSQRYQRIRFLTPDSSVTFTNIGFERILPEAKFPGSFHCSDQTLNHIWQQGVRTVDMCTVQAGETEPAWDVTPEGTRVRGQHWAPCRHGTRWCDKIVCFEVKIEEIGASWGVHMVANGLVFCLDRQKGLLTAHEGLSHESSVFASSAKGSWEISPEMLRAEWLTVQTVAEGATASVSLNGVHVASLDHLNIHPILGGSENNSGSVAFGGPAGWCATYCHLSVTDLNGKMLYANSMQLTEIERTLTDFGVGTNKLPCLIDGAKRDRSTFGGDLHISGRSVAYSTADFDTVRGSIELLTSHQTEDGYLGTLCPIQAPVHDSDDEPPTYAFYSLTYALLLTVAIKDYWLYSGDRTTVDKTWNALLRLVAFTERFHNDIGLIAAPPPLSLTFFPLGGPVFGVSTEINLAFYDALRSMADMAPNELEGNVFRGKSDALKEAIVRHLWSEATGVMRMSDGLPNTGVCQLVNAYSISLGVSPVHCNDNTNIAQANSGLPSAFVGLGRWSSLRLCSPYSTAFAVEACFERGDTKTALDLIRRVWEPMTNAKLANYSGGLWEAMTTNGEPYHDSTSLVHAWSSSPVYLLPKYLAGLRPVEPAWKQWETRPVYAGLREVRATVQTPSGLLKVHWEFRIEDGSGSVVLEVPPDTKGTVLPPDGWLLDNRASTPGWSTAEALIEFGTTRLSLTRGVHEKTSVS